MSRIAAIASHLPAQLLTNEELATRFPSWTASKIFAKTGILERRIADHNETAGDLAFEAANKLFKTSGLNANRVDMLLLVTQTPDQALPTTACRIHQQLGLPQSCGAIDLNQGCSGYIYGLAIADGLISNGTANTVLLLTADTYSKLIDPNDRSVATLFGDGASATLICRDDNPNLSSIGPIRFGTDGGGADFLRCDFGGWRTSDLQHKSLYMDGAAIMTFTLSVLPSALKEYLSITDNNLDSYDHVVFHQANRFILEKLYAKIGVTDKGVVSMVDSGNTVSSTIPLALEKIMLKGKRKRSQKILLSGFGVGLSWGFATIVI
jgi:3-oxoacyl-[acyl-carrier-protein] synthase-3